MAIEKIFLGRNYRRTVKPGSIFLVRIDQRFPDQNRIAFFIFKSIIDLQITIATMITIKNLIRIDRIAV